MFLVHIFFLLDSICFLHYLYQTLKFPFRGASSKFDLCFQNYVGWKTKVSSIKEQNVSDNLANQFRCPRSTLDQEFSIAENNHLEHQKNLLRRTLFLSMTSMYSKHLADFYLLMLKLIMEIAEVPVHRLQKFTKFTGKVL